MSKNPEERKNALKNRSKYVTYDKVPFSQSVQQNIPYTEKEGIFPFFRKDL